MAKKKIDCPDCCTYTITINPKNCGTIWDEQARIKKLKRKHASVQFIINKIISEYELWKDHQETKAK